MEKKRIGVLTGGGDCAGLNPAIKWVVKTALDERLRRTRKIDYEVLGIRDGWKGLVQPEGDQDFPGPRISALTEEMVRTWDRYGGTNLGTSRTNPYDPKNNRSKIVLGNIERYQLDFIVAIGGEDTLGVAHKLCLEGVNVVGIPKTIDKDLSGTDYTLGFRRQSMSLPKRSIGSERPLDLTEESLSSRRWEGMQVGWRWREGSRAAPILFSSLNTILNWRR